MNLYAASSSAFAGPHQEIADIFHAWAPGMVSNADLHFETCTTAQQIPERMRKAQDTDLAVGILMARHGLDADEAHGRLRDAAERAGVVEIALVACIIDAVGDRRRD